MTTARDIIVDALDIESFVLCESELERVAQATCLCRAATRRAERESVSKIIRAISAKVTSPPFRPASGRTARAGRPCHPNTCFPEPKFIL